jgi:hypothetical protein
MTKRRQKLCMSVSSQEKAVKFIHEPLQSDTKEHSQLTMRCTKTQMYETS